MSKFLCGGYHLVIKNLTSVLYLNRYIYKLGACGGTVG